MVALATVTRAAGAEGELRLGDEEQSRRNSGKGPVRVLSVFVVGCGRDHVAAARDCTVYCVVSAMFLFATVACMLQRCWGTLAHDGAR